MGTLKGYTLPLSPSGRASIVQAPPWHFSGDVLYIEYLADPDAVRDFMPAGLSAEGYDGTAAAIFGDWQSCTDGREELIDPVRSQYREFYIALACEWRGQPVVRCPFCWVDRDFSLVRGLIQGYPKKMGSIAITRAFPIGRATPRVARGGRFAASLSSYDRRLVDAQVTLTGPALAPPLMLAPLVHTRYFPQWDPGGEPLQELVTGGSRDQSAVDVWTGDAELSFHPSPVEDLSLLAPVKVLRGYRFSFAETITGGCLVDGGASEGDGRADDASGAE